MTDTDPELPARRWDDEYRRGRYLEDPPIAFVQKIVNVLTARASIRSSPGLYIGCGNGRNYLPLVDAGLNLYGLDVAPEALRVLARRRPAVSNHLICEDFAHFRSSIPFGYVIAIQVFQHGMVGDAAANFRKVSNLLRSGGLFFLRVNSAGTQVYYAHRTIERTEAGGFTVRYLQGPKRDLPVHFFSLRELELLTQDSFCLVDDIREEVIRRTPPQTGSWAQWEMVCERSHSGVEG